MKRRILFWAASFLLGCGAIDAPGAVGQGGANPQVGGTVPFPVPGSPGSTPAGPAAIRRPFPQALSCPGCIKPSGVDQKELNRAVQRAFERWKATFLRTSNGGTPGGGYYITMYPEGGGPRVTSSEAHGYGMLIFALMAGYDPNAHAIFDGFYNIYDRHRSKVNPNNMSWSIGPNESTAEDDDSATDGDMDIAYALLLADKQWGSNGAIDYLSEAKRIITQGIKASVIGAGTYRTLLGDWSTQDPLGTRTSDWMFGHFRAFKSATGDATWDRVNDATRLMVTQLTSTYSATTGLVPDFVTDQPPRPAPPNFLEASTDGAYSWNACRFPWRLAVDYFHNGSAESKAALERLLSWAKAKTGGDPTRFNAGYRLDGTALVSDTSTAFISPLVAASIIGSQHQAFLDAGWAEISNRQEGYYADTLTLLGMLVVSGNWWAPN